jgi:hypothetical protein
MRSLVLAAALCCSLPVFALAQGVQQSNPGNQPGQSPQPNQGAQQRAQSQQQAPNEQSPQPNQGVQPNQGAQQVPSGQAPNAPSGAGTTSGQNPTVGPHGVMMIMCSSAPAVTQAPDVVSQQARSGIQSQDANLKQWAVHCP